MPRRGGRHQVLVKGAEEAMTAFKMEVIEDLGLMDKLDEDGSFKMMSTVEVGQIGGEMVRRIQAAGEWAIKQRYETNQPRLMPEDVLPNPKAVRAMTNNGNMSVQHTEDIAKTPGSGQQWEPGTAADRKQLPPSKYSRVAKIVATDNPENTTEYQNAQNPTNLKH